MKFNVGSLTLEKLLSGKIRKRDKLENLEIVTQKQDGEVYRKAGNQHKDSIKIVGFSNGKKSSCDVLKIDYAR